MLISRRLQRLASFIAADIAACGGNVRSNKKTSCEPAKVARNLGELPILTQ